MRESIGGAWIFTLVIAFILIFAGYLAVSVNYSKAFKVKDKIVLVIEQNEGLSSNAQSEIESYLTGIGYTVYGKCSSDEKGFVSENLNNKYKYCVKKTSTLSDGTAYYRVKVFFRLDLPVFGNIFTFPITGETYEVHYATDSL